MINLLKDDIKELKMRQFRILKKILKFTNLDKALYTLLILIAVSSLIVYKWETNVETIFDGFWWSLTTVTTVGYGDIIISTKVGRVVGVILMVYGVLLLSLITGTIVAYASEIMKIDRQNKFREVREKISKIEYLSKEELLELKESLTKVLK